MDRLWLHEKLCELLESRNVYYNPPSNLQMKYPAIRYSIDDYINFNADNSIYNQRKAYSITLISANIEDPALEKLSTLSKSQYERSYTTDGLHHSVFIIYI